jgi:hypothetical protein
METYERQREDQGTEAEERGLRKLISEFYGIDAQHLASKPFHERLGTVAEYLRTDGYEVGAILEEFGLSDPGVQDDEI